MKHATDNVTRWTSTLPDHIGFEVWVRNDFVEGDRAPHFSWSADGGERWYASGFPTAKATAAHAHGCSTGIATLEHQVSTKDE